MADDYVTGLKKQFFRYRGRYYPIQSVSFLRNDDGTLDMYYLTAVKPVETFEGKLAIAIAALLDELTFDLEMLEEE